MSTDNRFNFYNSELHSSGYLIQNNVAEMLTGSKELMRSLFLFPDVVAPWHVGWQPEGEELEAIFGSDFDVDLPGFLWQPILDAIARASKLLDDNLPALQDSRERDDKINKELDAIAADYDDNNVRRDSYLDEDLAEPIHNAIAMVHTLIQSYNQILRERCEKKLKEYSVAYSSLEMTAFQLVELELRNTDVTEDFVWACVRGLCAQEGKTVRQVSAEVAEQMNCKDPFENRFGYNQRFDYGNCTLYLFFHRNV